MTSPAFQFDPEFAHLHVHSESSRDGLGTIERLVSAASELGYTKLAVTDHGSLASSIAFTLTCQRYNIKPIIGYEAYVSLPGDDERYHLTLLADGDEGFKTLVTLNNLAQAGTDKSRPTFDLFALERHNAGLMVLTGCPASPMQALDWPDAQDIALRLKSFLGPRLMAEVMLVAGAKGPWERAAKLARDCKLAPVLTNDAHFQYRGDAEVHKILTKFRMGFDYESENLFLATPEELRDRQRVMAPGYSAIFEAGIKNAANLSTKLQPVNFTGDPKLPHIPKADFQLAKKAWARLQDMQLAEPHRTDLLTTYQARLTEELQVIQDMGFSTYFIILADIIDYARSVDCRVGPGRGSGAGSLTCYLTGITDIDPIKYALSFDRFLNRKRKEMPDIDTDFEAERRQLVMEYAKSRWSAIPVATYSRWSHKSLVHDLSRVFHVPRDMDQEAADDGEDSVAFKRICARYPLFADAYKAISGQVRHTGQHAAGVIIVDANTPVPLERTAGGDLVAGWVEGEHRELTTAGIVKFDLLGLSALSILRRLEEKHGRHADDPSDNDPVFELFRQGDLVGIFQFSGSQGILDFTREVAPTKFDDLVAINALYRPGALDSGAAKSYPAWRVTPRLLDPLIDDILAPTYGVICYQEQFMEIFAKLTGGTMADADLARKVLSKARPGQAEWEAKFAQLQVEFFDGAKASGMADSVAKEVWAEIITHTRYSFNKSHSVAYARVAWEMAWWKYHHTADFYAATLSVDRDNWQRLLFDVVARGIEVVSPHVNFATMDFESDGTKIWLPLSVVKHLGEAGCAAIMQARPFKDTADFMARVPKRAVPKRARLGLLELGAFEGLNPDAKQLDVLRQTFSTLQLKQQEYMGLYLPDRAFLQLVETATLQGFVAGVVVTENVRESKFGQYKVWTLLPEGAVWSRDLELEVGQEVKLKIKKDSGKILSIAPLA